MDDLSRITTGIEKGDEASFRTFYDAYFPRLYRYLLKVSCGKEDLARDALQESMMRVIKYMKRFDHEDDFWNWLRRIARSAFVDQVRRRKGADAALSISSLEEVLPMDKPEQADDDLIDLLHVGLDALNPGDRGLIEGKYIQGKSYDELAADLRISSKAVESRLARVRKTLKAILLERLER